MRTKKGFRLRELGGDYILIGESAELVNFNNIITFNEAAAYLWQAVQGKDFDVRLIGIITQSQFESFCLGCIIQSRACAMCIDIKNIV